MKKACVYNDADGEKCLLDIGKPCGLSGSRDNCGYWHYTRKGALERIAELEAENAALRGIAKTNRREGWEHGVVEATHKILDWIADAHAEGDEDAAIPLKCLLQAVHNMTYDPPKEENT